MDISQLFVSKLYNMNERITFTMCLIFANIYCYLFVI